MATDLLCLRTLMVMDEEDMRVTLGGDDDDDLVTPWSELEDSDVIPKLPERVKLQLCGFREF